ncbi:MAG: hypothetical protein GF387_00110 [Candidatus Portnoybacteria bacterium]|nr:hypothetical protein [Candidatus Portnoybacteria bacterium]
MNSPDTALKAKEDIEDLILIEIQKYESEAHCTYFPIEEKYNVQDQSARKPTALAVGGIAVLS